MLTSIFLDHSKGQLLLAMTNLVTDIDADRYDAVIRCSTNSSLNDMDKSTTALIVPASDGGDDILPYPSNCHATNVNRQNRRIREANENRARNKYDIFNYAPTRRRIHNEVERILSTDTNISADQRNEYVISTITDLNVLDMYANEYEIARSRSGHTIRDDLYVSCTYAGRNDKQLKLNTNMAQASLFYANYMPMTLTTIYNPEVDLTSKYYIILQPNGTGVCRCEIDSDNAIWEVDLIPITSNNSDSGYSLPTVLGSAPTLDAAIHLAYVYSLQYGNEELGTYYTPMVVTRRTLIDLIYKYNALTNSSMLTNAYPIYQASSELLEKNARITVLHYGDSINTRVGHIENIDIDSNMLSSRRIADYASVDNLKDMQLPELMWILKGVINYIAASGRNIYMAGSDNNYNLINLADIGCFDLGDNAYILYRLGLITMFGFDKEDRVINRVLDMYLHPEDYNNIYADVDEAYSRYTDADQFMEDYQYEFTLREDISNNYYTLRSELYEGTLTNDNNILDIDPLNINNNDILVLSNLRMLLIYYLEYITSARYTDEYGSDIIYDYTRIEDSESYIYDITAVMMLLREIKRRLILSYVSETFITNETIPDVPTTDIEIFYGDESLADLVFRRNALFIMHMAKNISMTINMTNDDVVYNRITRCAINVARQHIQSLSISNDDLYDTYRDLCDIYGDMPYVRELIVFINALRSCCNGCTGKSAFITLVIIRIMLSTASVPNSFIVYHTIRKIRDAALN